MNELNKVAKITLLFWLMKVVATTLGETLGDFISMTLNLGYASGILITLTGFLLVLGIQIRLKEYVPTVYWLVIVGTTTLGTEISDFLDRSLHMGYAWGSLLLVVLLGITLALWFVRYRSLEMYPITKRTKELYYWIAILFSNSLGTAFGDFLSDNIGLTYLQGALVTGVLILILISLHYVSKLNQIMLFWLAFILTRPFGATFGDLLTKPLAKGGLNLGTLPSTLVSVTLLALLIFISHKHTTTKE